MTEFARPGAPAPMQFRVLGPDSAALSQAEFRRLFRGQRLTVARRNRLEQCGRILALCGSRVVGLAAYERTERELRVGDVGMDTGSSCGTGAIANGLLDALELACLAGGVRRLVLLPHAGIPDDVLLGRGYTTIARVAAGTWFEKRFV